MAFAGTQHRRLRGLAGCGGRGIGICARTVDAGVAGAAEGHAQTCRTWGIAVRARLLLRMPEKFSRVAQGDVVSRMDRRGRKGLSRTARVRTFKGCSWRGPPPRDSGLGEHCLLARPRKALRKRPWIWA